MDYLTEQQILEIHALIIDATGGSHGVRDVGLLRSIVGRPKTAFGGVEMYPDVYTKASVYVEAIVLYHVFVDGNKRTAVTAMARFLALHGITLTAPQKEVVELPLWIATEKPDIQAIALCLKKLTKAR